MGSTSSTVAKKAIFTAILVCSFWATLLRWRGITAECRGDSHSFFRRLKTRLKFPKCSTKPDSMQNFVRLLTENKFIIQNIHEKVSSSHNSFKYPKKKSPYKIYKLHSNFCLRILFSSSTNVLSEVACPMSLFLFSFCWNVSTRRFLDDALSWLASSSVPPEWEHREKRKQKIIAVKY